MDTVFPNAQTKWRAIDNDTIQPIGYWCIASFETLTAILCWVGCIFTAVKINAPKKFSNYPSA